MIENVIGLQNLRAAELRGRMHRARSIDSLQTLLDDAHRLRGHGMISASHVEELAGYSLSRMRVVKARREREAVQ
jgi:hypothetical protein